MNEELIITNNTLQYQLPRDCNSRKLSKFKYRNIHSFFSIIKPTLQENVSQLFQGLFCVSVSLRTTILSNLRAAYTNSMLAVEVPALSCHSDRSSHSRFMVV